MDLQHAFETLEIDEGASLSEIKKAYRDLALIWHPDHHTQNTRLHPKALGKMKELNAAYDCIRSYLISKDKAGIYTSQAASGYDEQIILTCPNCGTKNRIRTYTQELIIRCGKCGSNLFNDQDTTEGDDWEERILCGDGECIGVIGPDGRCKQCGKSFEKAKEADEYKTKLREQEFRQNLEKSKKRKKVFYIAIGIGLSICIFIAILEYSDNTPIRKLSPLHAPREITNTSPPIVKTTKRSTVLPNKVAEDFIKETLSYDSYYTKEFFKKSPLDKESIVILQRNLLTLGYQIGRADGVIGKKTLTALKQFSTDFRIKPKENFANDLLAVTSYNAVIASVHPDWRTIVKNDELGGWISEETPKFSRTIREVLESGDPRKIITLLNYYKFDKEKPPPLPLPKNGVVRQYFGKAVAPLKISTRHINQHHYIKLVNLLDNKELLTAFIRGDTTLKIGVPLGRYELRYAVGETWFGENFLFGPNTIFGKADKIFEFKQLGHKVFGYSVELFLQPNGNLRTQEISAFDF